MNNNMMNNKNINNSQNLEKLKNIDLKNLIEEIEEELKEEFKLLEKQAMRNSKKILKAFSNNNISEMHFGQTTGYGYNDFGRDAIDNVFAEVLEAESAIARAQFISGTHALTVAHFGILRPGDTILSITGLPYDSLQPVIGIHENQSSLKSYGVKYEQIDLIEDNETYDVKFDEENIIKRLKEQNVKLVTIQKSKGYATRKTILNEDIGKIISKIREVNKDVYIMVDNCYGEFVEEHEPTYYGADLIVGSLIKNLGGGIAPNGGYIAGREELVNLCAERLTVPGQGRDVGPTLGMNKYLLQGIYHAPNVVLNSLKTALFTSKLMEKLGFKVSPTAEEQRGDIVQSIIFEDENMLKRYIQGIQKGSAIDSNTMPIADDMPGYKDKVIMASGSFISGSSIELSCDGPIREPYIAFQQGGLTYEYGKLGVIQAVKALLKV